MGRPDLPLLVLHSAAGVGTGGGGDGLMVSFDNHGTTTTTATTDQVVLFNACYCSIGIEDIGCSSLLGMYK